MRSTWRAIASRRWKTSWRRAKKSGSMLCRSRGLDLALEGERALDAVALHHPLAVAVVVLERGYFDLEHSEPPPHPEEVGVDRGPVVEHPFFPGKHAVHDPEVSDHFLEGELADAFFAAGA